MISNVVTLNVITTTQTSDCHLVTSLRYVRRCNSGPLALDPSTHSDDNNQDLLILDVKPGDTRQDGNLSFSEIDNVVQTSVQLTIEIFNGTNKEGYLVSYLSFK